MARVAQHPAVTLRRAAKHTVNKRTVRTTNREQSITVEHTDSCIAEIGLTNIHANFTAVDNVDGACSVCFRCLRRNPSVVADVRVERRTFIQQTQPNIVPRGCVAKALAVCHAGNLHRERSLSLDRRAIHVVASHDVSWISQDHRKRSNIVDGAYHSRASLVRQVRDFEFIKIMLRRRICEKLRQV